MITAFLVSALFATTLIVYTIMHDDRLTRKERIAIDTVILIAGLAAVFAAIMTMVGVS